MKLLVNGEDWSGTADTLASLLETLEYEGAWLATAVNGELVPRADRPTHVLNGRDRIEILSPMQGG